MSESLNTLLNNRLVQLLLESIGDGVFTLNPEGFITSWNCSMEKISGYSAGEIIGKRCSILEFSQCFGKQCPVSPLECGILKYGRVDPLECFFKHKDNHIVPVIKNAKIIRENNEIAGIVETVTDMTELKKAKLKIEEAFRQMKEYYKFGNLIGRSHVMQQVFSAIKAAASSEATVLIQGESGTGKELVAGAIHFNSERKNKPMITVNCSALPESLLESELFGHVKGAFTGAVRDREGRFEEADGGSIFLDEIGEISPLIQVKLLRVIQEREIERVGESKKRKVNMRIITATNKDLYELVKKGLFREDLYYRLKVFPVYLPPFRKRREDIPILASHFIDIFNKKTGKNIQGISQEVMRILMDYNWPGNVRELENAIEHAFVLCSNNKIDLFDLPVEIRQFKFNTDTQESCSLVPKKKSGKFVLSKEILLGLLFECNWNKAEAARRMGLSRAAIWKYMKKWDIPNKKPS
ncbi:Putative diguanylate cyclase [Desulfonema limicola]|uniref:Diguanylate cyclase n=1 Tax=Desulfonema limicola TaxID=45656 RepID=A0A975B3Q3_9BACT|nr:sigma 54-interacting transcriptional regulator [Desulfonema limicola]QTA78230.1 Putative diguanylate cyclase [Desulfonema limicola]